MKYINYILILILCLSFSLAFNYMQYKKIDELNKKIPYLKLYQPLIDKSIEIYAKEIKSDKKSILKGRFPVATEVENKICISLYLTSDAIGFIPIYCFNKDGDLIYKDKF